MGSSCKTPPGRLSPMCEDDSTARYFDDHVPDYGAARLAYFETVLHRLAQPDDHLVDIGAGTGSLLAVICNQTPIRRLAALDVSAASLARCRERTGCEVICGSICSASLAGQWRERFNFALMSAVLHHLIGPTRRDSKLLARDALVNAVELLRPGGHLLLMEPVCGPRPLMTLLFYLKKAVSRFTTGRVGLFGYWNNVGQPIVSYLTRNEVRGMVGDLHDCHLVDEYTETVPISRLMKICGVRGRANCYVVLRKGSGTSATEREAA